MKLLSYAYYGIIILLSIIIVSNYISYLLKKQNTEKNQILLKIDSFPPSLLSRELRDVKEVRIVFIYSEFDCEECIISYLKALKEATLNLKYKAIQVIGIGEINSAKFIQYAKIYKLNFAFSESNDESIFEIIQGLELPAVILINKSNKIIACWRAEPIHFPIIMKKVRNYLNDE